MKQYITHSLSKLSSILYTITLFGSVALLLSSCFLKQDRTTTIYGTVTDQNGRPVDSILVIADGVQGFKYETLKKIYSDEEGKYEMMIEVPKKYSSTNIIIPFWSYENSKYTKHYLGKKIFIDGNRTNQCCSASIGEKTKYDFQLVPK